MFHLVSKPLHGMDHNMWNGSGVLSRLNVRHRRSTRASDPKTDIYIHIFYIFVVFKILRGKKTNEFCLSLGECTKDRKHPHPPPDKKDILKDSKQLKDISEIFL